MFPVTDCGAAFPSDSFTTKFLRIYVSIALLLLLLLPPLSLAHVSALRYQLPILITLCPMILIMSIDFDVFVGGVIIDFSVADGGVFC